MTLSYAQEYGLKLIRETQVDHVIGIDEVGLGACAGPLVVCGAVFQKDWSHNEVKDSKKFSGGGKVAHDKRVAVLERAIKPACLFRTLEVVTHKDIDALGMGHALEDAIRRAAIKCSHVYPNSVVVVDGVNFPYLSRAKAVVAIPEGDGLVPAVSAASIIAKTTRDSMMFLEGSLYPGYGFEQHMGYWTEEHKRAVLAKGPCPIHRMSYKNVKAAAAARGHGTL